MIAISTDTSCTIDLKVAEKLNINVFPLNVIVNGDEFLDGVSINQDQLNTFMREGKTIKTSTPPPQSVIDYFNNIFDKGYEKVIHFTISSKLSSMYTLFCNISNDYFDNKVVVVDAYSLSLPMLSLVLYAYEEVKKQTPIELIVDEINKQKMINAVAFVPENLTALKNGGRISPAIAAIGNMIGLKPLLTLTDGKLEKDSMSRNAKKLMSEKMDEFMEKYPLSDYDIVVVSFDGDQTLVNHLTNRLNEKFPNYPTPVLPIAINVCAHAGPGTIGITVSHKINGKSLLDYLV